VKAVFKGKKKRLRASNEGEVRFNHFQAQYAAHERSNRSEKMSVSISSGIAAGGEDPADGEKSGKRKTLLETISSRFLARGNLQPSGREVLT